MATTQAPVSHLRENPFEIAREQLRRVAEVFEIDQNLVNVLQECKKAVEVSVPVAMDDGSTRGLHRLSRRAQHRARSVEGRNPLPPRRDARRGQGARDVDDVEVRARGHSVRRREGRRRLQSEADVASASCSGMTRRFTSEIINQIGPEVDIPAPDVGTDGRVMAWIFDTYSMNKGHSVLGVVTGKPLTIGGSLGREEATARGALYCMRDALAKQSRSLADMRIAVQGFGNVGSFFAKFAAEDGATRRRDLRLDDGASQPEGHRRPGGVRAQARDGLARRTEGSRGDHERGAAARRLRRPRAVRARAGDHRGERVAGQGEDDRRRGERADHAARRRDPRRHGRAVLPDILANAGGVIVSYFEWVQGLQEYFWKEAEVNAKLNDIVTKAFDETWETMEERKVSMRTASYGLAVQRVAEATVTRGIYP